MWQPFARELNLIGFYGRKSCLKFGPSSSGEIMCKRAEAVRYKPETLTQNRCLMRVCLGVFVGEADLV